jgi:hypothetical protein
MKRARLWELTAAARLNVVRHGMHECIPWRMTESLAMGSCPVFDYAARTRWPEPLEEGEHYLNLAMPFGSSNAAAIEPREIATNVERWLANDQMLRNISANTAKYFDNHLTPPRLGEYMVTTAVNRTRTEAHTSEPTSAISGRD